MAGIPRLQELTFLEQAATSVHNDETFEEVRRGLIRHMAYLRADYDGSGNSAAFGLAMDTPGRYVSNASESLKELMRLGYVVRAPVPASRRSAQAYLNTTYALTQTGTAWVNMLESDPRSAYDELFHALWRTHPQFGGFVDAVGSRLTIPLSGWREAEVSDLPIEDAREAFVSHLVRTVAEAARNDDLGWEAIPAEVDEHITGYLDDRYESARRRNRPDPYPRTRDFVNACEEAIVKFAFAKAGCSIDYISHEILRRWMGFFGVVNFSYHVPSYRALRLWSTATVDTDIGGGVPVRPIQQEVQVPVIRALPEAFETIRTADPSASIYVSVYKVRAAVTWDLGISDSMFDAAIRTFVASNELQRTAGFSLHLDASMYGAVPPTERPLRMDTATGSVRRYNSIGIVPFDERKTK